MWIRTKNLSFSGIYHVLLLLAFEYTWNMVDIYVWLDCILILELMASLHIFNFIFWWVYKHQRRYLIIYLHKTTFTIWVARKYGLTWNTILIKNFDFFFLCPMAVAEWNTCIIWNTLPIDIRLYLMMWRPNPSTTSLKENQMSLWIFWQSYIENIHLAP